MRLRLAAAALCFVFAGGAPAGADGGCAGKAPAAVPAPIARAAWEDMARFGFLLGRDSSSSGMNLMARLRKETTYSAVRNAAMNWGYLSGASQTWTDRIAALKADLAVLGDLCRQLDDWLMDDPPQVTAAERAAWWARFEGLRRRIAAAVGPPATFLKSARDYKSALAAFAAGYRERNYPVNPIADMGPDPARVAGLVADFEARWAAISHDLEGVMAFHLNQDVMTFRPNEAVVSFGRDDAIIGHLSAAATSLRATLSQSEAIAAQALPFADFQHLFFGDYLHDACAGIEGQWIWLDNLWWAKQDGVLTVSGERISVVRRDAPFPGDPGRSREAQLWMIQKADDGYWTLTPYGARYRVYLGIAATGNGGYSVRSTPMLAETQKPVWPEQYWRCYRTDIDGAMRFSNAALGEDFSVDTFATDPQAVMATTGRYGAQYWRVRRD